MDLSKLQKKPVHLIIKNDENHKSLEELEIWTLSKWPSKKEH